MLARHAPGGESDELLSGGGVDGHAVVRVSKITYAGQTCPRGARVTSSSPAVEWMATQLSGSARLLMLARHAPGGEGDELLSGGGVDGHAVVKVGLRAAHLHRHAESLHHLVRAHAYITNIYYIYILYYRSSLKSRVNKIQYLVGKP